MKKIDIVTVLITFIVGSMVGTYLYIYGFMPQYSAVTEITEEVGVFALVVREYGECTDEVRCISYRIDEEGNLRLLRTTGVADDPPLIIDGKIDDALMRELKSIFTTDSLKALSKQISSGNCASFDGQGTDYQLEINISGALYGLDTCDTAFSTNIPALNTFNKLQSAI